MCGIAGFFDLDRRLAEPELERLARAMAASIVHRGPDGEGVWTEAASGTALAHRRLSIIDLSEAGRQPMVSASGRTVISYNGEAYNYEELRDELAAAGVRFRGHSDTEALLEGIERWGLGSTLRRVNGMFALAVFDRTTRTLSLARDRLGQKPLYWGWVGRRTVAFASELKALTLLPGWEGRIDRAALAAYFRHNYVPGPLSIYEGIGKLAPGSIVTIDAEGEARHSVYWSARQVAREGLARPFTGPDVEAIDRLEALLADAVRRCMVSDVPLGAFLSGGIDSAIVVAQMAELVSGPVRTFTIGFSDEGYDERRAARTIAERFGTDHTDLRVTPDAGEILPRLVRHFGEPFADSSAIPSFYLAELARSHVTVALNGDGGDESFAGYRRHLVGARTAWLDRVPSRPRRAIARVADRTLGGRDARSAREYAGRLLGGIGLDGVDRYHSYLSVFSPDERRALLAEPTPEVNESPLRAPWNSATGHGELSRILQTDVETYLPGDLLVKMDIATMAHSLEARSPLLDHHLMEFAAGLPDRLKLRRLSKKWILRQAYRGTIPDATLDAPKRGFGVPLANWFRGPLGAMARERLAGADACGGLIRPERAQRIVAEHRAGKADRSAQIWTLLVLDEWCRQGRG